MKVRKYMVFILAILMVLGFAIPGFAATTGEKHQWLIDKGYVKGRLDNGVIDYAFESPIERDEITKMIVIVMGKEGEAPAYRGKPSVFSDVPKNHWGIGEINLATEMGWIEGYPEGDFKPDKHVTFAEVCAILTRVDDRFKNIDTTTLKWPDGYVDLARQFGVLDDVKNISPNSPAKRGLAFEMIYNVIIKKDPNQKEDPGKQEDLTVTFDPNGGVGGPPDFTAKKDSEIDLSTLTVPTFGGKIFKGWKEKDGDGTVYTGKYTIKKSITLVAVWEDQQVAPEKEYKITIPTGMEKYIQVSVHQQDGSDVDKFTATKGRPVTIRLFPPKNKVVKDFKVTGAKSKKVGEGYYVFVMPDNDVDISMNLEWYYTKAALNELINKLPEKYIADPDVTNEYADYEIENEIKRDVFGGKDIGVKMTTYLRGEYKNGNGFFNKYEVVFFWEDVSSDTKYVYYESLYN
ncbi:MAG: S-layer homology domain-containing protein [Tissierellia bacterium]|nr:S-layer homology domain-containing protein [Tissierellia bacterium]